MKNILALIRPHQWVKNLIVMLPIFFSGQLFNISVLISGFIAFFSFSFAASSIYCLNDIIDVEEDRRHPIKCKRPLASGAVSIAQGYVLIITMLALSMLTLLFLPSGHAKTYGVIGFYWLLNIGYCLKFKQYAIIDVCIVAFGFVLRVLAGGWATNIVLSKWIVLMTFLLMLFLAFAKRRDDVVRMMETGRPTRQNTIRYNLEFINQAITITSSITLVCYIMYTVSEETIAHFHTQYLYLTSIFVLVGILRYIQLAVVDQKSGDPTKVMLKDRFMQIIVLLFGLSFLFIIYFL